MMLDGNAFYAVFFLHAVRKVGGEVFRMKIANHHVRTKMVHELLQTIQVARFRHISDCIEYGGDVTAGYNGTTFHISAESDDRMTKFMWQ